MTRVYQSHYAITHAVIKRQSCEVVRIRVGFRSGLQKKVVTRFLLLRVLVGEWAMQILHEVGCMCVCTLTECILLILGRKFSLSLLNVISKPLKNLFMPSRRDVGLQREGGGEGRVEGKGEEVREGERGSNKKTLISLFLTYWHWC